MYFFFFLVERNQNTKFSDFSSPEPSPPSPPPTEALLRKSGKIWKERERKDVLGWLQFRSSISYLPMSTLVFGFPRALSPVFFFRNIAFLKRRFIEFIAFLSSYFHYFFLLFFCHEDANAFFFFFLLAFPFLIYH